MRFLANSDLHYEETVRKEKEKHIPEMMTIIRSSISAAQVSAVLLIGDLTDRGGFPMIDHWVGAIVSRNMKTSSKSYKSNASFRWRNTQKCFHALETTIRIPKEGHRNGLTRHTVATISKRSTELVSFRVAFTQTRNQLNSCGNWILVQKNAPRYFIGISHRLGHTVTGGLNLKKMQFLQNLSSFRMFLQFFAVTHMDHTT